MWRMLFIMTFLGWYDDDIHIKFHHYFPLSIKSQSAKSSYHHWFEVSILKLILVEPYMCVGPCWRVPQAICKNQDILLHCCGLMGCWLLCQGGWWCSCQSRYDVCIEFYLLEYQQSWKLTDSCGAGMLITTLGHHKLKPRVYIGCMKSGPVLSDK